MLQVGPQSLHFCCTIPWHSSIILPPVGHSSNHAYPCCQLTGRSSSGVLNLYHPFKVFTHTHTHTHTSHAISYPHLTLPFRKGGNNVIKINDNERLKSWTWKPCCTSQLPEILPNVSIWLTNTRNRNTNTYCGLALWALCSSFCFWTLASLYFNTRLSGTHSSQLQVICNAWKTYLSFYDSSVHKVNRLKSGNIFHHSVQNLESSSVLSKNTKTEIKRTIMLPLIWYRCETWSLTMTRNIRWGCLRTGHWGEYMGLVTGEWRKLHNKELYDLYYSPNTIRVIKSWRMRWEGHVAHTGDRRGAHRVMVGKPEGKNHLEVLGIEGRIILICIFRMWGREHELASFGAG